MLFAVQYVTIISIICGSLFSLIHRVDHGYICVYFRGGYLINKISGPGIHLRLPIITDTLKLPIKPKSEQLPKIDCTTSDGVKLVFDQVQIVYAYVPEEILQTLQDSAGLNPTEQLIKLPIKRALQQFCEKRDFEMNMADFLKIPAFLKHKVTKVKDTGSSHQSTATLTGYFKNKDKIDRSREEEDIFADNSEIDRGESNTQKSTVYTFQSTKSGIKLFEIHLARPKIPDSKNQLILELASSRQKQVLEKERLLAAVHKAKTDSELSAIIGQGRENDKFLAKKVAQIQDVMDFERAKSRADVESYRVLKIAEANRALFTDEYFKNLEFEKLKIEAERKMEHSGQDQKSHEGKYF